MNDPLANASRPSTDFFTENCSLPTAHGVALITINAIVGFLGTLGNLLVCVAVTVNPRLRRCSNYLLVSLAIADLISTMVCEPLFLEILLKRTFYNDCVWSSHRLYSFISHFSAAASVVHMSAISIDRLIAVVFPLRHRTTMEGVGIKAMLAASWALTIALFLLGKFLRVPNPVKNFLNLAIFVFCYAIVFVSYTLIVMSLIRKKKQRIQLTTQSFNVVNSKARVAFTLAIVITVFTVCWFPLFGVLIAAGKPLVNKYGYVHFWIRTLALSNSAINFLIYGSRMRNFRETYAAIFRKILGSERFRSRRIASLELKVREK